MMVKKEAPMSDLGHPVFDTTVQKTNQVLKDIEQAYGWPKQRRQQSYDAPLPMLVRGLYYQGWKPARVPVKMDREEFLERIRRELDFEGDTQATQQNEEVHEAQPSSQLHGILPRGRRPTCNK